MFDSRVTVTETTYTLRKATLRDIPPLQRLIADSVRGLCRDDYTEVQIEAALGIAWGVDSQLIRDETFFMVGAGRDFREIVGCGGWSRRRTLFGADRQAGREAQLLDPTQDSARVRAFFVRPDWARRGIGRTLLQACEAEARAEGFRSLQLMATLPGQKLYRAMGFVGEVRIEHALTETVSIPFVPMRKILT